MIQPPGFWSPADEMVMSTVALRSRGCRRAAGLSAPARRPAASTGERLALVGQFERRSCMLRAAGKPRARSAAAPPWLTALLGLVAGPAPHPSTLGIAARSAPQTRRSAARQAATATGGPQRRGGGPAVQ